MSTHVLVLPGFLPQTANQRERTHRARRAPLMRADAQVVAAAARQQGIPPATGKRLVSLMFSQPKGRLSDHEGRLKVALDMLVECGLLADDGPGFCQLGTIESVRGLRQTVITLEDC